MKKKILIILIFLIILILAFVATKKINFKSKESQNIPKIYLEGNIEKMFFKSDEREVTLKYVSDDINFKAHTKIKIQGHSSLDYAKKNYTIKMYQNSDFSKKQNIDFGWGEQNKYCLKANWIDKTHSRNIVTARITAEIQKKYNLLNFTPNNGMVDGFPVELYINNEFLGLYTLNIPKDEWLFSMDSKNQNHIILLSDTWEQDNLFLDEPKMYNWEIETNQEKSYVFEKLKRLTDFIMYSSDEEFKNNFNKYLDLDATLNYYVIQDFAELYDNTARNMLLVTYDGEIWYPYLYDLDSAFGTYWDGESVIDYKQNIQDYFKGNKLWLKLLKNFPNEIADRYFELRKDILTKENVLYKFNEFISKIPTETFLKEQKRWEKIPGYDINQIETFLAERIPIVDSNMYNLYTIKPNIEIKYSQTSETYLPVKAEFATNRKDITIMKDEIVLEENSYTFKKNGTYTFTYKDWYGNIEEFTIKIDWIKDIEKLKNKAFIALMVAFSLSFIVIATSNISKLKRGKSN